MIRIDHYSYQPSKVFGQDATNGELWYTQTRYALGYNPPHYPVPATIDVTMCYAVFSHDRELQRKWTVPYMAQKLRGAMVG